MTHRICIAAVTLAWTLAVSGDAAEPPPKTSFGNSAVQFRVAEKPYFVLKRGDVTAVVVDNRAVDDAVLPGHKAGYSGVASLTHATRRENLFVPAYAGLNFEHIHDGTTQARKILFEPRNAPLELRVIDEFTAELYQPPTPHFGLESCTRYQLRPEGTIEMTFECVPRRKTFRNGYIGLFWASYIHQPESLDIHFRGHGADEPPASRWVRGVTPEHGKFPTHLATRDDREFPHDADFPLTLVFHRSQLRYSEPWYYGVSHGLAFVQMFRSQDQIRFSQSPSGGGQGNPAWDFQCFIPNYEVGQRYQIVLRAMIAPFESPDQLAKLRLSQQDKLDAGN